VPNPQNRPAVPVHSLIPESIVGSICMLASIDFHNQIGFTTGEVGEIWTDRQLANKLVAVQSSPAQFVP